MIIISISILHYFLTEDFDNIFINNGKTDIIARINGTNMKNVTKYHATLFNPFIHKTFNINVINKINNISNITSCFGICFIPKKIINNDNDKYIIAGLCICNFI